FARAMHRPAPVRSSRGRSIHFTGALGLRGQPRRRDHDRTSLLWRFTDLPSLSCWRSFLLILNLSICPASNLIIIRPSVSPVEELRNLRQSTMFWSSRNLSIFSSRIFLIGELA